MKNKFIILALLTSCQTLFGQISVGIKSGANFSKQRYFYNDNFSGTFAAINGLEFGILGLFQIRNGFELKAELSFVQKGGKVPNDFSVIVNDLEFATLINYKITSNKTFLYTGVGGFAEYGLFGHLLNLDTNTKHAIDFNSNAFVVNRFAVGLIGAFGIGFNANRKNTFFLEGRYRHSLTFFQNQEFEDFKSSNKNVGLGIHLGYIYKLKKD